MKYWMVVGIVCTMACISCKQKNGATLTANGDSAFTVTGTVLGLDSGAVLGFQLMTDHPKADTFVVGKDGSFTFRGTVHEPLMAAIYLASNNGQGFAPLNLFVESGTTTIAPTKAGEFATAPVKGGASNTDLQEIVAIIKPYQQRMEILKNSNNGTVAMDVLQAKATALIDSMKTSVMHYANNHKASYAAAFFAYQFNAEETNDAKLTAIYNNFSDAVKESTYAKKIQSQINLLKQTGLGSLAPNFTLPTPDGKAVSLSSLHGKYVLLDFWASWCGPCRQENPNVVKAYNGYKSKNFTVLSVSLDEDKAAWLQAIKADNLTWTQVSDLKGWNSEVAVLYGIQAIPSNVLLDKEGKILGKNLRGVDLENKLAEVLK